MAVSKPILVTMGDPCGVGPEVIALAAQRGALEGCRVIGDRAVIARAARLVGLLDTPPVITRCGIESTIRCSSTAFQWPRRGVSIGPG